jgi:translation initiation factor IF-1
LRNPHIAKEELLELEGIISEALPQTLFRVTRENGAEVIAYASGKMRKHRIRILARDSHTGDVALRPDQGAHQFSPQGSECGFPAASAEERPAQVLGRVHDANYAVAPFVACQVSDLKSAGFAVAY